MFELGSESSQEHKNLIESIINFTDIEFHFIGNDFYKVKIEKSNLHFYNTFEDFNYSRALSNISTNNTILIKGSRGMALERVLDII